MTIPNIATFDPDTYGILKGRQECPLGGVFFWWNILKHGALSLVVVIVLLMEEILHHLGCTNPCKYWDKLPTSTGAGFQPSTVPIVSIVVFFNGCFWWTKGTWFGWVTRWLIVIIERWTVFIVFSVALLRIRHQFVELQVSCDWYTY